jgi:hypothetical protein
MATTVADVRASLPDYADTYVKDMLSQTVAYTDPTLNPYVQYAGSRQAAFDPMQTDAFTDAAAMGVASQNATATTAAEAANKQALAAGTNYTASTFQGGQFGGDAAQQYMSPYTQNVTDIQTREAQRQADIATMGRNAQATGRGAFGGSRQAIMDSEAARNLATQKGDITATGLQNAYTNAQAQFNADQTRRMQAEELGEKSKQYDAGVDVQSANTALQGATVLGNIGDKNFNQLKDISGLNFLYGSVQQQADQQKLDTDYQNSENAKNYVGDQLRFRSNMLQGLPMTGNTNTTTTAPDPSKTSQGIGLLGAISGFFKKGGAVDDGGEPGLLALAASHYGRR